MSLFESGFLHSGLPRLGLNFKPIYVRMLFLLKQQNCQNFMQKSFLNVSSYQFVTLPDVEDLKVWVRGLCADNALKGSVMLSEEGINLMLSGLPADVEAFERGLKQDLRFSKMVFKKSFSEAQPFRKLLIKLKRALVPGMDHIRPDLGDVAPALLPKELKERMDRGESLVLIDTRNEYEYELGSFEGALNLNLQQFSELPQKLEALDPAIKEMPVVLFCTGGIRCEKAAPLAKTLGFKEVYQLDGGILQYFENCGGAHYRGGCFVFDDRRGVNERLE